MGAVKDLKRRQRGVSLKEKRLKAQGRGPAEVNIEAEVSAAYANGRHDGYLEASEKALDKAKDSKTIQTARRKLGDQVRRAR